MTDWHVHGFLNSTLNGFGNFDFWFRLWLNWFFLDATMHPYKRSCPSVASVHRSVSPLVPCYFQTTINIISYALMGNNDEIWHGPNRLSRTIHKWHKNVGLSVCPSIRRKKMNKKCRRGSRILWTPRFLLKEGGFVHSQVRLSICHKLRI